MNGPLQVSLTTHVDPSLKDELNELTEYLGMDTEAAIQEAVREWMVRYAAIHHYPAYGFDQGDK